MKQNFRTAFDYILLFFVVILYLLTKIGDFVIWILTTPAKFIIKRSHLFFLQTKEILLSYFSRNTYNLPKKAVKTFVLTNTLFHFIQALGKATLTTLSFSSNLPLKLLIKRSRSVNFTKTTRPYHRKPRFSFSSFLLGIILATLFIFIPYNIYLFLKSLPNPRELALNHFPVTTQIFDRNGVPLYEIYTDQNRTPISLNEVPQTVVNATIAIEDKEFYFHPGFSTRGILRALREIIINKRVQGGSTITQQLIKSALLSPEQTLERKIKEIVLAFWAERLYSKDQILEMYLNQVPYGGTAWGIQAASQTYFGKNVADLTLAEASLLAGLPAAPTYYSPFGAHPEFAVVRKNQVLSELWKTGKITPDQYEQARLEELVFNPQITNIKAPHFVMYVKNLLEQKYGVRRVEQGGLRVITSLDSTLQDKVQEIVKNQVEGLKNLQVGNGASLVTNPKTGEILAMVGSLDYFNQETDGNVNITTSLQQPGSSIKVVVYAAALENGFTAASIIDDSPVSYPQTLQPAYQPVNYDGKFHGKVTLRKALGNSYNVPAVKTLAALGVEKMIQYGRSLGIQSWSENNIFGLSLALGGGEVTMLDMARVYSTLADSGLYKQLTPVLKVTTHDGTILEEAKVTKKQVVKPETAYILTNILSDDTARQDAFGPNSKLVIPGKTVSVKTGTSNDKRDNWTIGFTPSYTVTVWVGNNNNSPMHPTLTSGITGATPIWNEIMTLLLKDKSDEQFTRPDQIVSLPCYGRIEYFVTGTQPLGGCPTIPPTPPTGGPTPSPTP